MQTLAALLPLAMYAYAEIEIKDLCNPLPIGAPQR